MRIVERRGLFPAEPVTDGATDFALAHRAIPPTVLAPQLPGKERDSVFLESLVRQRLSVHRTVSVAGEVCREVGGKLRFDVLLPVVSPLQVQDEGLHSRILSPVYKLPDGQAKDGKRRRRSRGPCPLYCPPSSSSPILPYPPIRHRSWEGWSADRSGVCGVPSGLRERAEVVGAYGPGVSAGCCSIHSVYGAAGGRRVVRSEHAGAVRRALVYGASPEGDVGETARGFGTVAVPVAGGWRPSGG